MEQLAASEAQTKLCQAVAPAWSCWPAAGDVSCKRAQGTAGSTHFQYVLARDLLL